MSAKDWLPFLQFKQEPVKPGDAPRIGFGHRQDISSSQYDDHFCKIALKSDFKK